MGRETLGDVKAKLENESKFLSRLRSTLNHGRSPEEAKNYDTMREATMENEDWSVGPIARFSAGGEYHDLVGDKISSYGGSVREVDEDELDRVVSELVDESNSYELGVLSENPDSPDYTEEGVKLKGVSDRYKSDGENMDLTGEGEIILNDDGKIVGRVAKCHKSAEGL